MADVNVKLDALCFSKNEKCVMLMLQKSVLCLSSKLRLLDPFLLQNNPIIC